jgi:hypothetical protein
MEIPKHRVTSGCGTVFECFPVKVLIFNFILLRFCDPGVICGEMGPNLCGAALISTL